jgi:type I restriction enzyme S subunit
MTTETTQQNIPSGWKLKTVDDLFDIGRGRVISKTEINEKPGPYPVYSSQTSNGGEFGRISTYDFDGEYLTWTTDGIYAGAVFHRSGKFNCTNVCGTLKSKGKDVDAKFFSYALPLRAEKHVVKTANPKLMNNVMAKVIVPVPPLKEQQKIAEILGTVDEEIIKTQGVIEATEKLKRGLMQQLFTRGIGHTEFKETKIGRIPESWDVLELGKVCDVRDGTHNSPKYHEEGFPLITSKNLVDGKLDFENVSLISGADFQEIERRSRVDNGDILFGMIGTIGNPVIVNKDRDFAIKNVALIKFTGSEMNNIFVLNFLKSIHTERQFNQKKGGSTQKFIALGVIRQIFITVPSKDEQKKIAEVISSVDEKISINKRLKMELTLFKKGLMQDLLSGKVRTNI